MKNISTSFILKETLEDAELDELFGQLEQFEAPTGLVGNIMAAISQLPIYQQKPAFYLEDYQSFTTEGGASSLC